MLWGTSHRSERFSLFSWEKTHFSSLSSFLVHLLCSFALVSVDILVSSVQHCLSDCVSFSASAPQLLRESLASQGLPLISTVVQTLAAVSPWRFIVVVVSTQTPAPLGPRLLSKLGHSHHSFRNFSTSSRSSLLSSSFLLLFRFMQNF